MELTFVRQGGEKVSRVVHLGVGDERFACGAKGKGRYTKGKQLVTCERCKRTFVYERLAGWR